MKFLTFVSKLMLNDQGTNTATNVGTVCDGVAGATTGMILVNGTNKCQ